MRLVVGAPCLLGAVLLVQALEVEVYDLDTAPTVQFPSSAALSALPVNVRRIITSGASQQRYAPIRMRQGIVLRTIPVPLQSQDITIVYRLL